MTRKTPTALRARLLKLAHEREIDYGCDHTSKFGQWCAECREAEWKLLYEAAAVLAQTETRDQAIRDLAAQWRADAMRYRSLAVFPASAYEVGQQADMCADALEQLVPLTEPA